MTKMIPPRRRTRTHVLLLISLLCAIAGAVDLLGYFRLGQVFVANLTGNTVLFAYHASAGHWEAAALRLALLLAFFSGIVSSRILKRWAHSEAATLNPAVVSLAIECGLLATLALISMTEHLQFALLLPLAWAMGLQNDAFQKIGPVNLNTTFLTGDIEKLGSTIASPPGDAERSSQRRTRIEAFVTAWLAYGAGAILGAIGNHFVGLRALLIPAVMAALVMVLELTARRS